MRHTIVAALAVLCFVCGPASAQTTAPSERAVLFEEDNTPTGSRFDGTTTWSVETVSPGRGEPPERMVRAVVTIPDRQMTVSWTLRHNTDAALPASHVIEIMFKEPGNGPGGEFTQVPGMLMKPEEMSHGTPLAGTAVKVVTNYFLFGLSAVPTEREQNVELLRDLDWIDIPIVRTAGNRLILAVQKGVSGGRAFDAAFAAWNDSTPMETSPK
jgi:hypothetical protein